MRRMTILGLATVLLWAVAPSVGVSAATPAIEVTKTGELIQVSGLPVSGDLIQFVIWVSNVGDVSVDVTSVTDSLKDLTQSRCLLRTFEPGTTGGCFHFYEITQADIDRGLVVNTATVEAVGPGGVVVSDTDTELVLLDQAQAPALDVLKDFTSNADEDGSGTVSLGDTLTFTITATNTGNTTLTNVVVTDDKVTATGGTTPCLAVKMGEACTLVGTYTVAQGDIDAGFVVNTGSADSNSTGPVSDEKTVPIAAPPPEPNGPPVVVVVQGINSSWTCEDRNENVEELYGFLSSEVTDEGEPVFADDTQLLVFSYSGRYEACSGEGQPNEAFYHATDTCDSIDDKDPFDDNEVGYSTMFRDWYERDFDLDATPSAVHVVAHSMGGVVVAHALSQWATVPDNLASVTTLDSPLQGHPRADLILVTGLPPGGRCGLGSSAIDDFDTNGSTSLPPAIADIFRLRDRLDYLTTIGNNADDTVGPGISHLPGAWLTFRIDEGKCGLLDHQCVWVDPRAHEAVFASVTQPHPGQGVERGQPQVLIDRDSASEDYYACGTKLANVIGSDKSEQVFAADSANQVLYGGPKPDVIVGLGGRDTIHGDWHVNIYQSPIRDEVGSADTICGGPSRDSIFGGPGYDRITADDDGGKPKKDKVDGQGDRAVCDLDQKDAKQALNCDRPA